MSQIEMIDAVKEFKIKTRRKGAFHSVKDFFNPLYKNKRAVDGISLKVEKGDLVGYIGPNGAGKSTTLKMLTGILVPTSGQVRVDGRIPYRERRYNAMIMGAVFGQRSQLLWDLPVSDTLELYQKMYRIDPPRYRHNRDYFVELLDMSGFMEQPARQLSLGQKMRANLALAMLHDPDILYLDEPTIGLDVIAKDRIRGFIRQVNREKQTTVMLTTHDMTDIESVCKRLVLIDGGKKLYDGSLDAFKARYATTYVLKILFASEDIKIEDPRFREISRKGRDVEFSICRDDLKAGEALSLLAKSQELVDVAVRETPIEEIVRKLYLGASSADGFSDI